MKRREFTQAGASVGALVALGAVAQAVLPPGGGARPARERTQVAMGTNLSGMEWATPGLRFGTSTAPNIDFSVPRRADIAWLASCGFTKNRLPIQWELLQPMLHDTPANAAARAAIGAPGEFHAAYASWITGVLDAHAAAGIKCILDNHNYCRYQDFRFQPDGSVAGLTLPPDPLLRPYTSDPGQVQVRIFSLAPGATLRQSHFADFWTRAARRWMHHPGFGGYGLMSEPHDLPQPGDTVASDQAGAKGKQDLTIWPAFAQSAIDAIRKLDSNNPIYVGGNDYSSAMAMATHNPGFPLSGANLVYEVHMYLDAVSSGAYFDYEQEVAKRYAAGLGSGSIGESTGLERLRLATAWAREHGVRLALTEVGMPVDDPRWEAMFRRTARHALDNG
ncbi:MAG: Twin-arginine translocation pathway signal, partial [Polaromonas sp.]|nr:Twin-arginine translocation pathway signal [Polaromonas sp.]